MEMLGQILAPRVEDGRDPDRPAEVLRILAEGEERVRRGAEEHGVEDVRVALRERVEGMGQREDEMEIRNGQQVGAPGGEPPFFREGLTLRTMPVPTRVVGHADRAAAVTRLLMPAVDGGATGLDGAQSGALDSGKAMGELIARAVRADDVGELHPTGP